MAGATRSRTGRALRAASAVACAFIGVWGFYATINAEFALDLMAAIYGVATIAMACWIIWTLGKMAQQMVDGQFAPNFGLWPPSAKKDEKPDA